MKLEEIRQEVFNAPFGIQEKELGFEVIRRPDWYQVISSAHPTPSANEVIHSEISESELTEVIDKVTAQYASIQAPFKWCVTPWTKPQNMADMLKSRGFGVWNVRGMYTLVDSLDVHSPSDVQFERLSEDNLEEYIEASLWGWNRQAPTEIQKSSLRKVLTFNLKNKRDVVINFLARKNQKVVGTSGMIVKSRSVYLVAANVLPEYRGLGIYRGLLNVRLDFTKKLGLTLAVTHARENTSAPILEKLGFQTAYKYQIFQCGGVLPE